MSSVAFIVLSLFAEIAVVWLAYTLGRDVGRYG